MALKRSLILTKAFEKSYKKFTSRNEALKSAIAKAILKLENDAYDPSIRTHRLSGNLAAYFACSCGYDCRIIFEIKKDQTDPSLENILLLDIGTHDDVY